MDSFFDNHSPGRNAAKRIRETASILGFTVSTSALEKNVELAWSLLSTKERCHYMVCANPHSVITAADDLLFAAALREADLVLPDGVGILIAGKILGERFCERVTGMEFFSALAAKANAEGGLSFFFLGSSETVLERIVVRMAHDYPSIKIVGMVSPPFKDEFDADDDAAMIAAVNAARPDVLWVGMTAPKQEKWIYRNRDRLDVPFIGAIGAAFDFYAGTKKRAPAWVGRVGLEWLPRLVREPRRLWRRNFVSTPKFLYAVIADRLSHMNHGGD